MKVKGESVQGDILRWRQTEKSKGGKLTVKVQSKSVQGDILRLRQTEKSESGK